MSDATNHSDKGGKKVVSENVEIREKLSALIYHVEVHDKQLDKHYMKIEKIEDEMNIINKMEVLLELTSKSLENQNRVIESLEKTTNNLEYTVSNINTNITHLNESQVDLRETVAELQLQISKRQDENKQDNKGKGDFNWIDFITHKLLPTLGVALVIYFIYLITGIKL